MQTEMNHQNWMAAGVVRAFYLVDDAETFIQAANEMDIFLEEVDFIHAQGANTDYEHEFATTAFAEYGETND